MKIIALTDIHSKTGYLRFIGQALSEANLVLLAGDLTNDGSADDALHVINLIRQFNSSLLAVPGNWDGPEVQITLTNQGINMDRKYWLIGPYCLIGMGASIPSPVKTPNEITEMEFTQYLQDAVSGAPPDRPKIMVCHQPPLRTKADRKSNGLHVGSSAVREFIERVQPLVCFTGHIHEARGIDQIGNSMIINPGPLWQGYYAYAEIIRNEITTLEIRETSH